MKNVVVALPDQQTSFLSLLDLVDTVFANEEKGVAIFERQHLLYHNESFRKLQETYFISEAWIIQQSQSITEPKTIHNEWKTCELTFHRIQHYIIVCIKPYPTILSKALQLVYRQLFIKDQLKVEWVTGDKVMKEMKNRALAINPPVVAICGDAGTGKSHLAKWLYVHNPHTKAYLIELDWRQLSFEEMRCILQQLLSTDTQMNWLEKQYTLLIHHIDKLPFDIQWMVGELIDRYYPTEHIVLFATLYSSVEEAFCQGKLCEKLYDYFEVSFATTSLSERAKDIPLLISHYLHEAEKKFHLTNEALTVFQAYDWPGNVPELYQLLACFDDSLVTSVTKEQAIKALPAAFSQHQRVMPLADVECALIQKALEIHGYSLDGKKQAADALCISLSTLYNKMKTYNL